MFNGLINLYDFVVLAERLYTMGPGRIASKLARGSRARVAATWARTESRSSNWWEIPAVVRRWNRLITGDETTTPTAHVCRRYLGCSGRPIEAVSLGCGAGVRELAWARECGSLSLTGYDVSPQRVAAANAAAIAEDMAGRLRFVVTDVHALRLEPASLDMIITEGALHHFFPMGPVLRSIHDWLRPGGLFIVNEFVGPSRFQWTDRQLELARMVLARLPERLRIKRTTGRVKTRSYRPGRLSMYLNDPSEAAESGAILPGLRSTFEIVEERPYGGTLLQLVFKDIAHNFLGDDPQTEGWLRMAFEEEDRALHDGEITSDFVYVVARKRG